MKFHDVCVWWLIHIHGTALVKGIAHLTSPHHWFWHANGCGAHGTCGRCSCGTWWCLWYLRLLCLWYCYWRHWELTVRPFIKGVGWRRFADAGTVFRLGHGGRLYAAFGSTSRRSRFDASPSRLRRICQARSRCFVVPSLFLLPSPVSVVTMIGWTNHAHLPLAKVNVWSCKAAPFLILSIFLSCDVVCETRLDAKCLLNSDEPMNADLLAGTSLTGPWNALNFQKFTLKPSSPLRKNLCHATSTSTSR